MVTFNFNCEMPVMKPIGEIQNGEFFLRDGKLYQVTSECDANTTKVVHTSTGETYVLYDYEYVLPVDVTIEISEAETDD